MMIAKDSLQIRRAAIAYVFRHPLELQRAECFAFYEEITREIGPFPEMQNRPNQLVLRRRSGSESGELQINRVDARGPGGTTIPAGTRFLFVEAGAAKPVTGFRSEADLAYAAFRGTWGERAGRVQTVEVSYALTFTVLHAGGAPAFIKERLLSSSKAESQYLSRDFAQAAVRLVSGVTVDPNAAREGKGDEVLPGAQIEIAMEAFNADDRQLFVQLAFKWPAVHLNLKDLHLPAEVRKAVAGQEMVDMNTEAKDPSEYINLGYQFVEKRFVPYLYSLAR